MTVIEKVRDLQQMMLAEADARGPEDGADEHIYELYNFLGDWEAVWTNSDYDKQE